MRPFYAVLAVINFTSSVCFSAPVELNQAQAKNNQVTVTTMRDDGVETKDLSGPLVEYLGNPQLIGEDVSLLDLAGPAFGLQLRDINLTFIVGNLTAPRIGMYADGNRFGPTYPWTLHVYSDVYRVGIVVPPDGFDRDKVKASLAQAIGEIIYEAMLIKVGSPRPPRFSGISMTVGAKDSASALYKAVKSYEEKYQSSVEKIKARPFMQGARLFSLIFARGQMAPVQRQHLEAELAASFPLSAQSFARFSKEVSAISGRLVAVFNMINEAATGIYSEIDLSSFAISKQEHARLMEVDKQGTPEAGELEVRKLEALRKDLENSYPPEAVQEKLDASVAALLARDYSIAVPARTATKVVATPERIELEALESALRLSGILKEMTPRQLGNFKLSNSAKSLCDLLLKSAKGKR